MYQLRLQVGVVLQVSGSTALYDAVLREAWTLKFGKFPQVTPMYRQSRDSPDPLDLFFKQQPRMITLLLFVAKIHRETGRDLLLYPEAF